MLYLRKHPIIVNVLIRNVYAFKMTSWTMLLSSSLHKIKEYLDMLYFYYNFNREKKRHAETKI